jgi:hypothetical protein
VHGLAWAVSALTVTLALAACTGGSSTATPTQTTTITEANAPASSASSTPASSGPATKPPSVTPTGPTGTAPTTSAAAACPLIPEAQAADLLGQRLARVATQTAGGRTVGCQFFDVQGTALAASEHLSGPNQPALQISSAGYATAVMAHNAMVLTAEKGANAHASGTGIAYRTTFDPVDGANRDWAFAFTVGTTLVVVLTNQGDSELDAEKIGQVVAAKFAG